MAIENAELRRQIELRTRAASKLSGADGQLEARLSSTAALRVLHGLASSPTTAADAIALLHELQVHQVELDLQCEELQGANAELEASLDHKTRLYEHAPVAMFSVDAGLALIELNLAGTRLLDKERHALIGKSLSDYLTAASRPVLLATIGRIRAGADGQSCTVELAPEGSAPTTLQASINADPAGAGFLIALVAVQ